MDRAGWCCASRLDRASGALASKVEPIAGIEVMTAVADFQRVGRIPVMELTRSWERVFDGSVKTRYQFAEVRNAAATLHGTNPTAFGHVVQVLSAFTLSLANLTDAGKNKSDIAHGLDLAFRQRGWREGGHQSETRVTFTLQPYRAAGETKSVGREVAYSSEGHKVDNVFDRAALDVEWNAKDGNLDRDLANFRALHEAGLIDVGIIITRHHERTKYAANRLAELANVVRANSKGDRIVLLGTTTTTNLEKLVPRMERGDGGGCPVLAIAVTELCYQPAVGEPELPSYGQPIHIPGIPEEPEDEPEV